MNVGAAASPSSKLVLRDRSMRAALTPLARQRRIDADELAKALIHGLRDKDGQWTRREFRDARAFRKVMAPRLTAGARRVLRIYALTVRAAKRDDGQGSAASRLERMTRRMIAVKEPRKAGKGAGRTDTRTEANKFFTTQWGPNRWNGRGPIFGFKDCMPTSMVMALSAQGLFPKPTARNSSRLIDRMRDLSRGHNTNTSSGTFISQVLRGINAVKGAEAHYISPRLGKPDRTWLRAINAGLAKGRTYTIAGHPWAAWGRTLRANGAYLNSSDPGHHACAILGRTKDGKYLVADPLSRRGTIAVSGERLIRFWRDAARRGDTPGIVSIRRG